MEDVPMAPPQQPSRVLVLVYPEHATAEIVYEKIRAMDKDGRIKVVDAALVTADERGELTVISTHRHATKSFAKAAAGGLLIGAALSLPIIGLALAGGAVGIGAHKSDRGKEQEFADRLRTILKPSHSAVFVTGDPGTATADEMIAELAPYGGELAQSSILLATEDKLRKALREVAKEADAAGKPELSTPAAGEPEPGA
jgi:uncharacterized membrane protein